VIAGLQDVSGPPVFLPTGYVMSDVIAAFQDVSAPPCLPCAECDVITGFQDVSGPLHSSPLAVS
jgi:hypothetical protein